MKTPQYFFDWDFDRFETVDKVGQYEKVISRIFWTLWGSDEHGNRVALYGETEIPTDAFHNTTVEDWVDFGSIEKQHIEELLEDTLGEDKIAELTDNLTIQLDQLAGPKTSIVSPPWL